MKKEDILKKLESIKDNTDITGEILGFAKPKEFDVNDITLEQFKDVLEKNEKINGYYQSTLDKGINTFKEKTMPGLIEEEIKKRDTSNLTPEQVQLRELQKQLDEMKAEKERAEILNTNANKLKEIGLDTELARYIQNDDDVNFFRDLFNKAEATWKKEKLGEFNYKPPKATEINGITKEQFNKMGYSEKLQLFNDNPSLYETLSK